MGVYVLRFILWIVVLIASLVSLAISIYALFYAETSVLGTIGIAVSLYIAVSAVEKIHALLKGKPEE